jgi:hypothetical protein
VLTAVIKEYYRFLMVDIGNKSWYQLVKLIQNTNFSTELPERKEIAP